MLLWDVVALTAHITHERLAVSRYSCEQALQGKTTNVLNFNHDNHKYTFLVRHVVVFPIKLRSDYRWLIRKVSLIGARTLEGLPCLPLRTGETEPNRYTVATLGLELTTWCD